MAVLRFDRKSQRGCEKSKLEKSVEASATPPFDLSAAIWKGIPGSGWVRCADLLRSSGGHKTVGDNAAGKHKTGRQGGSDKFERKPISEIGNSLTKK
jgi:hypothetical protein